MDLRWQPLVKGALSFAIPPLRTAHHPVAESAVSAEYCYSVFLRHFSHLARFTDGHLPRVVAELGPGDSLGTGLAAVIAGAERCIGLDVQDHTDAERNLRVFDELVDLFRKRTPVPGENWRIATQPVAWDFPRSLEGGLERALAPHRLAAIRQDIVALSGRFVGFVAPWRADASITPHDIDWIFSHSVMEHVEDVEEAYRCSAAWLVDGGYMTHEIDYGSHGLTRHWNGHWTIGERAWRLVKGARPFLINRFPHEMQVEIMGRNGFELLENILVKRPDGLAKATFVAPYATMSDDDAQTHVAFVVCQKGRTLRP